MMLTKRFKHLLTKALGSVASGVAISLAASESPLTLEWDPNQEPDIAGYRLYRGTLPGVYETIMDLGNRTTVQLSDLDPGGAYFFAVTAYDLEGLESGHSSEYEFHAPLPPKQTNDTNLSPIAFPSTITTPEDQPTSFSLRGEDPDSALVRFVITSFPTQGRLTGTPPHLTYIPRLNYVGRDAFTFTVNDGKSRSEVAKVEIDILPVDDIPIAVSQNVSVVEDVPQSIRLEGIELDGNPLEFRITRSPNQGAISGSLPDAVYTPAPDYSGPDSFEFVVFDGTNESKPVVVNLYVNPVADKPLARAVDAAGTEDQPLPIVLSGYSPDGKPLNYVLVSNPSNGTLTGKPPQLTYVPNPHFNGSDAFIFQVTEGTFLSEPSTVSIVIAAVNDAPIAVGQTISVSEDEPKVISLGGTDVDGDSLTVSIVTAPKNGKLDGTGPQFTYTPNPDFHGADSFSFTVSDGRAISAPAVVSLVTTGLNDAPIALSESTKAEEDSFVRITLRGNDKEGSRLTYRIVNRPANGTLTGDAPNLTYRPLKDFTGVDVFTFVASDGSLESEPATITVQVLPINDTPVAMPMEVSGIEDQPLAIDLKGVDVDGNPLTFTIFSAPTRGQLSGTPPNLVFTPARDFNGADSLRFTVSDGTLTSPVVRVSINIQPVNDAPIAVATPVRLDEDTTARISLSGTDVDGDPLTYEIVGQPSRGKIIGTLPNLIYAPDKDFFGDDSFQFVARDAKSQSAPTTVPINVMPINDAPKIQHQKLTLQEDGSKPILLTATSVDGDPLTYSVTTPPKNGKLSGNPPNLVYTPDKDFSGTDTFTFTARDGTLNSDPCIVTITVLPENDPPIAQAQVLPLDEDTRIDIVLRGSDDGGQPLSYKITQTTTRGTLSGTPPNLSYRPGTNFVGTDTLQFTAFDGQLTSSPGVITLNVRAVNDAPVAVAQNLTLPEDDKLAITLRGSDVDGDRLTYSIISRTTRGTLTGTPPNLTYTPAADFTGTDKFTFTVNDGRVTSAAATVTIQVTPVNDAPVAVAQSLTVNEDTRLPVILKATDVDNSALTYSVTIRPARGVLSGTAPNLFYQPNTNFNGADSFTFVASDGKLTSAPVKVSILVVPINDAPVAQSQSRSVGSGSKVAIVLSGSDVDGDTIRYTIATRPTLGTLSGTVPNLTYTAPANYSGTQRFSFVANDGNASSAVANVTITVTATAVQKQLLLSSADESALPSVEDQLIVSPSGSQVLLMDGSNSVLANDGFGGSHALKSQISVQPAHGQLTLNDDGTLQYVHNGGKESTDSFKYIASNESIQSAETSVKISIFRILDTISTDSEMKVQFSSVEGLEYEMESNTLAPDADAPWTSLTGRILGTAGVMQAIDSEIPANSFYRIVCHTPAGKLVSEVVAFNRPSQVNPNDSDSTRETTATSIIGGPITR